MSDEYGLQLSLSLPPVGQYAKGDMLNIRGKTPAEFAENLAFARELAEKDALMARFFGEAEAQALAQVEQALDAKPEPEPGTTRPLAEDRSPERVISGITDKQRGLVFGIARRKELSDKDLLALASKVAGGKVSAITDLTKAEASKLIDALQKVE